MMNPEIKARWVEALRSGKYEQGTGLLRSRDDKFCCLGVLVDVLHPDRWTDDDDYEGLTIRGPVGEMKDALCTSFLPKDIVAECGLREPFGDVVNIELRRAYLSSFNDLGFSFGVIADAIESQL